MCLYICKLEYYDGDGDADGDADADGSSSSQPPFQFLLPLRRERAASGAEGAMQSQS